MWLKNKSAWSLRLSLFTFLFDQTLSVTETSIFNWWKMLTLENASHCYTDNFYFSFGEHLSAFECSNKLQNYFSLLRWLPLKNYAMETGVDWCRSGYIVSEWEQMKHSIAHICASWTVKNLKHDVCDCSDGCGMFVNLSTSSTACWLS